MMTALTFVKIKAHGTFTGLPVYFETPLRSETSGKERGVDDGQGPRGPGRCLAALYSPSLAPEVDGRSQHALRVKPGVSIGAGKPVGGKLSQNSAQGDVSLRQEQGGRTCPVSSAPTLVSCGSSLHRHLPASGPVLGLRTPGWVKPSAEQQSRVRRQLRRSSRFLLSHNSK